MKLPRVLIGSPVSEEHAYVIKRFLNSVRNLSYKNYDVFLVDNSKNKGFFRWLLGQRIKVVRSPYNKNPFIRISTARNYVIEYFLSRRYDYLLMLDTDTIIPRNGIQQLLKHKKDVVGFLCHYGLKRWKQPSVFKSGSIIKGGEGD